MKEPSATGRALAPGGTRARLWVAAGLSLPIVLAIACYALVLPHIEFLRPSMTAAWIVHPTPGTTGFYARDFHSADVYFTRAFNLEELPPAFELRVTALDRFAARVNGVELPLAEAGNWKRGRQLDLAPYLRAGRNRLLIRVSYAQGTPALLVEGRGPARDVGSDRRWRASHTGTPGDRVRAARALEDEAFLAGPSSPVRTSPHFAGWRFVLYGLLAFIGYAVLPLRLKPWLRERSREPARTSFGREKGLCLAVFVLVAATQLHNAATFASMYGMPDTRGHVSYVLQVAEQWRVPLAEEGWQMYQPPLFYFVAASLRALLTGVSDWFSSIEFLQVLNTCFGLANLVFAWMMVRTLFPQNPLARNLGFSVAAMLPMAFYMAPNVTNEVFAASMMAGTVLASVALLFDGKAVTWGRSLLIGSLCGLSLLSKFTGVFALASVLALLTLRAAAAAPGPQRHAIVRSGMVIGGTALAIAGWFYLRNWLHYGDPFVGNWDYASGFHYEQAPGYRTAGFYTGIGALPWRLVGWSSVSSFWEGMYGSLWTDLPGFFTARGRDARIDLLESLILWLALLPTLAIALGFLRACRLLISDRWDHPFFLLVTTSFWTLSAVVLFTLELPFYSTVAAFFGLSLVPAIAVFAGLGLETLCRQLGRLRVVLFGDLACLYGLTLYLFAVG